MAEARALNPIFSFACGCMLVGGMLYLLEASLGAPVVSPAVEQVIEMPPAAVVSSPPVRPRVLGAVAATGSLQGHLVASVEYQPDRPVALSEVEEALASPVPEATVVASPAKASALEFERSRH